MISYHLTIIFILWSSYTVGQVPKCEEPPDIDFGERINDGKTEYHEGDKVRYQCSPSTTLVGSEWIECHEKNWTPLPKCSGPCIITRQQLEEKKLVLSNGKHRSVIILNNQSLEFSCADGYVLTKPSLRTCVDGHMDFPTCISEIICKPPHLANGDIYPHKDNYRGSDEISYNCKKGFYPPPTGNKAKCTPEGWLPLPRCIVRPCDYPEIENGKLYRPYWHTEQYYRSLFPMPIGKEMAYHCNKNYVPAHGSSSSYWTRFSCTAEGWSPVPECLRECSLFSIENGHFWPIKGYYKEGDEVTVQCNDDYSLPNNQDKITCTKQGWSTDTKCIKKKEEEKCGPPPSINNGDILSFPLSEYAPESRVEYRCQQFYVLQGSQFVTCRNGLWTKEPTCLEACTISKELMMKNNIEFRWVDSDKLYSRTGQDTEFSCIRGYHQVSESPPFRAKCINGKINYPRCA